MALDLRDCSFFGPALPEPFVKFELEDLLRKKSLLPKATGLEAKALQESWDAYRRLLRALGETGGATRVFNHVLQPLAPRLGYDGDITRDGEVKTREGMEDGGWVLSTADGKAVLRAWPVQSGEDLDAPNRRGRAYRFSPAQVASRILLAKKERVGLLTDGTELRLLVCDPAGRDSHIEVRLDRAGGWRGARNVPDSFRLLLALACPKGVAVVPNLVEAARLTQTKVTGKLREQAKLAVQGFMQEVLDHPGNRDALQAFTDHQAMARALWHEGLVLVYRLLFVLKLESSPDPARAFGFASSSLWRNTWSPNVALARYVMLLRDGKDTGRLLEDGLRGLFRLLCDGLQARELTVKPFGGMLFGSQGMPTLDRLRWGEHAVAALLENLLWTRDSAKAERRRVYYGPLDVEDLGRVYESLLELEPGITTEPMCRLQRAKLQVVVPVAQGQKYRTAVPPTAEDAQDDTDESPEDDGDEAEGKGKKTKVQWIEEIPAGRFYLRVGLGRKASGSYYTPHSFVKFLVRETLEPLLAQRSPMDDPRPGEILKLKVLDPAMGSGHFLVEVARFLGDKLYEACRLCDERALDLERRAEGALESGGSTPPSAAGPSERNALLEQARDLRRRVEDLPDPDDELVAYLPSRAPEGEESGLSQFKALALCRRLVAVHCLYGVDKNPLAVELAKLSLWIEAHAEGLPLTFLDHRLVVGDSLTGPFFENLLTLPGSRERVQDLFRQGLADRFTQALDQALAGVKDLEKSVGVTLGELHDKQAAKAALDRAMAPFRIVAAAWTGGVMLGPEQCDDAGYTWLLETLATQGALPESWEDRPRLRAMIARGLGVDHAPSLRDDLVAFVLTGDIAPGLPYDLAFPEVFFPAGRAANRAGFDVVVGNPPWDTVKPLAREFLAAFDLRVLDTPTKVERAAFEKRLLADPVIQGLFDNYQLEIKGRLCLYDRIYVAQRIEVEGKSVGGDIDLARLFAERTLSITKEEGFIALVLPGSIHVTAGAVGVRRLFLDQASWIILFSFLNSRYLFEIEGKVKFSIIVVRKDQTASSVVRCRFRLTNADQLFEGTAIPFPREFIRAAGGMLDTFPELESPLTVEVAQACATTKSFKTWASTHGFRFSTECHPTNDATSMTPVAQIASNGQDVRDPDSLAALIRTGYLIVGGEDSIHQYDDHWTDPPRYAASLKNLKDRPTWLTATRHFRLLYRRIANIVDLRSMKAAIVPPGWLVSSPFANRFPMAAATCEQLVGLAVLNSFPLDWNLRLRITNTLNVFIVQALPFAEVGQGRSFAAHAALRLTCNHEGYAPLWQEQLGDAWHEPKPRHTWPVLVSNDERWAVRAAIDAVVADAYGLDRDQYAHVLSTFSHKSYPKAPELCLAAFDELKAIGLEAFTRKHDPYWDIPLNESLPKPVIALPTLDGGVATSSTTDSAQTLALKGQQALFWDDGPLFSGNSKG